MYKYVKYRMFFMYSHTTSRQFFTLKFKNRDVLPSVRRLAQSLISCFKIHSWYQYQSARWLNISVIIFKLLKSFKEKKNFFILFFSNNTFIIYLIPNNIWKINIFHYVSHVYKNICYCSSSLHALVFTWVT